MGGGGARGERERENEEKGYTLAAQREVSVETSGAQLAASGAPQQTLSDI